MGGRRLPVSEIGLIREKLWVEIRRLRVFKTADLVTDRIRRETVARYLKCLTAAGILRTETGQPVTRGSFPPQVYTLIRDVGVDTPRVRKNGGVVTQGLAREQLWRAMRILREFNPVELHVAASTPTIPVHLTEARFFVGKLNRAGYLTRTRRGVPGRMARYRLLPTRNTGPKPPMVQANGDVYDPNLKRVVWYRAAAAENADG